MRSNLWASGYDVDGTDKTSLGQFSGCVLSSRFFKTLLSLVIFFFSSRRRHTRYIGDWSSDVCSSDLGIPRLSANLPRVQREPRTGVLRWTCYSSLRNPSPNLSRN